MVSSLNKSSTSSLSVRCSNLLFSVLVIIGVYSRFGDGFLSYLPTSLTDNRIILLDLLPGNYSCFA